ncbi:MAG: DUF2782 domain-containing protein [Rhodanobacter sp.]|jgi:hypothetical protein
MKTPVVPVVVATLLATALFTPALRAQAAAPRPALPPPGLNDPGVQASAPPASSVAPPANAPKPDLRPLTLPAMKSGDSRMGRPEDEPEVRIRQEGDNTVQEYSRNGRVYMVVVTPKHGLQQTYMIDPQGRWVDERGQRRATPTLYKVLEWGKSPPASRPSEDAGGAAPASSSSR